jgi:hypothetical protein
MIVAEFKELPLLVIQRRLRLLGGLAANYKI